MDEYAVIRPQTELAVKYVYRPILTFLHALAIIIVLFLVLSYLGLIVWNLFQTGNRLIETLLIVLLVISYYFAWRSEVRFIEADERGLRIGYWVRWNRFIPWGEVSAVFIIKKRGIRCHLNDVPGIAYFRVADFFGLQDGEKLISTIIHRAKLKKTENPQKSGFLSRLYFGSGILTETYLRNDNGGLSGHA